MVWGIELVGWKVFRERAGVFGLQEAEGDQVVATRGGIYGYYIYRQVGFGNSRHQSGGPDREKDCPGDLARVFVGTRRAQERHRDHCEEYGMFVC